MAAGRETGALKAAVAALAAALVVAAAGCSGGTASDSEVVVLAASSLGVVVEELELDGVTVTAVVASSSTLVGQLEAGVEADVLITADEATMDSAVAAGSVRGEPVVVATNTLVLATAPDNPGGVTGLDDLARSDLLVGLCAPEAPCGALARRALEASEVSTAPVTLEPNARALTAKLALGELDAGLIYRTDAENADLPVVSAPELDSHLNRYHIAAVATDPSPEALKVIEAFTTPTGAGANALGDRGFGAP